MKFSVLMSVYHKENPKYFDQSLNSIFNQKCKADEIVLVKDGPLTDELERVISEWEIRLPLKVIELEENKGLGDALNIGLKHCNNELIGRMDTDDIAKPERFKKQVNYLKSNPNVAVLGTWVQEFNEKPGDLDRVRTCPKNDNIKYKSKYRNPVNHPSVMFYKKAVLDVGSYKDMCYFEDYYLWIRLLNNGYSIENLDESLMYFRIGNDMVGRRLGWEYLKCEWQFYHEIHRIGFIGISDLILISLFRLPIRLLPKGLITYIYNNLLRN